MWRRALLLCLLVVVSPNWIIGAPKTQIAYVKNGYIWVCGEDGVDPTCISPKGKYSGLRWSPDGTMLSCVKTVGLQDAPCIVTVATAKVVQAKDLGYYASIPQWSPDGKSIVFSSQKRDWSYENGVPNPPAVICTYKLETGLLTAAFTLDAAGYIPAPAYVSQDEIAYADGKKSQVVLRNLATGKSRRITVPDQGLVSPDYTALEIIPFAGSIVVVTEAEQGDFLSAVNLTPGKPSFFPGMLKRLETSLEKLDMGAVAITPAADGNSAYVLVNNEADLAEDGHADQARVYMLDARGSHKLFSIMGNSTIRDVAPFGGGRIIYRRPISGFRPDDRRGDLRIYDLKTKTAKTIATDAEELAVWPRR